MSVRRVGLVLAGAVLLALAGAVAEPGAQPALGPGVPAAMWRSALPDADAMTPERVALGKALFFDKRLSVDDTISCASCHDPRHGFSDPHAQSLGVHGKKGARHAPTVVNAMFNALQFWDGRAATLEDQAKGPLTNKVEMAMPSEAAVVTKVAAIPEYAARFRSVFGHDVTIEDVATAIADYERMQVSADSPFDRFTAGDKTAMSPAAQRGYKLFTTKGKCATCHAYTANSPFFTDFSFHNTGIGARSCKTFEQMAADMLGRDADGKLNRQVLDELALTPGSSELGRFLVTVKTKHLGSFKTPTLRDVEVRGPYMHDGSLKTLRAVLEFYNDGCQDNCNLDPALKKLKLTSSEMDDLEAFLKALTGDRTRRLVAGQEIP